MARSARRGLEGFAETIGIEILSLERSEVVGRLLAAPEHANGSGGQVHGGALMAFADTLGALGTVANLRPGFRTTTIESKTNFLAATPLGPLTGTAIPLHIGRTTQVWQTTIADQEGRRVAIVTQTQLVLPSAGEEETASEEGAARGAAASGTTAAERQQQIFAAASDVIARKGYAKATVRDIAEAAGMPVPTMYKYVRSKEDILALIFETYMTEIERRIEAAGSRPGTARERLAAAIAANFESYDTYFRQIRLMYQETRSLSEEGQRRAIDLTRRANRIWSELIEAGIEEGDFAPVNAALVANFIPMLCATWTLRFWNVGAFGKEAVRDAIVAFVLAGLSRREASR